MLLNSIKADSKNNSDFEELYLACLKLYLKYINYYSAKILLLYLLDCLKFDRIAIVTGFVITTEIYYKA